MALESVLGYVAIISAVVAIVYLVAINVSYLTITAIAIQQLRRQIKYDTYRPVREIQANEFLPGVTIVVPAYNEEDVIIESVESMHTLDYPNAEVIVVNDGSTDGTLDRLRKSFDLRKIDATYPVELPCEEVNAIYRASDADLVVIDKENGGKADALNAGLYFSEQHLFCAVDADTIIESGAITRIVEPFLADPQNTVATGGVIRIANGCRFRAGALESISLPDSMIERFQATEYLRAFLLGRIGLSNLNSLLVISGAFGLFRTDILREIGGYDTDSITEDMEIVVRLHRHVIDTEDTPSDVTFLPHPIAWTEAPRSLRQLSRQRRRWFRGRLDTLVKHRAAIGRPTYGIIGLFALPFFLFFETLGPLFEAGGYVLVPLFFLAGLLDVPFFATFIFLAIGLGTLVTVLGVLGEVMTYRRYERPRDVSILLWYAGLEAFIYRPWRAFVSWRGLIEYLKGDDSWGEMVRSGIGRQSTEDARGREVNP